MNTQKGYSLIELMIALVLSTVLMLGISGGYSSIKGLVLAGKNIENAQEVIRFTWQVFDRSLKQTQSVPLIAGLDKISIEQTANSVACNGSKPNANFTEIYTLSKPNLLCDIGDGEEIILTGVESITFIPNNRLISITVTPQAQQGSVLGEGAASALQIDMALSSLIISSAMGT